jgi:3-oxoacyl-[acyl-carrier protein] reductase
VTDLFSLAGQRVLVTGASSGLGQQFALVLAAAGADVALSARRIDRLEALAAKIEETGRKAVAIEMDVLDLASIDGAVAKAWDGLGGIDVLINNAGTATARPALKIEEEDWDSVLDTNLKGAFFVARDVARRMVEHEREGNIVNTASTIANRTSRTLASYAASKGGLVQLTRTMALELAGKNIRVNALAPGYIKTEINQEFFESPDAEQVVRRVPQKRVGQIDELDGPLLLLASGASSYMTGAVLTVDGGYQLG